MKFLPSVFTLLNLFSGYLAILSTFEGEYSRASFAILFAILFDILDGRIARLTAQMTKFGRELDSLADMVSFGVAPALLIYQFSLSTFGKQGWLASFLYTACVALRLAKFNVKGGQLTYFEGLPSPAGGALIASTVIFLIFLGLEPEYRSFYLLCLVYFVSFLMVSPLKYPSLKEFRYKGLSTFYFLVLFLFFFILTVSKPSVILFFLVLLYILFGPLLVLKDLGLKIWKKRRIKEKKEVI